jgi:hypothetical protein
MAQRLREDVGIERRLRAEREHLAVVHVHHRERSPAGAACERLLRGLLHVEVERQAQLAALLGVLALQRFGEVAEGVDLHARGTVASPQEAVVLRLDAGLADAVAQLDPVVALVLQLLLGDLAHLPEQMRAHGPVWILAQELALRLNAGEPARALEHVEQQLLTDVLLHRRLCKRERLQLALHPLLQAARIQVEQLGEAPVDLTAVAGLLRELVRRELDREGVAVLDQRLPVPVHDLAARRLHLDLANPVVLCLRLVLVAREDLQVPEPEEDQREHHERNAAHHGHAEGELRGQGRAALVVQVHA